MKRSKRSNPNDDTSIADMTDCTNTTWFKRFEERYLARPAIGLPKRRVARSGQRLSRPATLGEDPAVGAPGRVDGLRVYLGFGNPKRPSPELIRLSAEIFWESEDQSLTVQLKEPLPEPVVQHMSHGGWAHLYLGSQPPGISAKQRQPTSKPLQVVELPKTGTPSVKAGKATIPDLCCVFPAEYRTPRLRPNHKNLFVILERRGLGEGLVPL